MEEEKHFTCFACFAELVTNYSKDYEMSELKQRQARIPCPCSPGCKAPAFASEQVAAAVPKDVFELYVAAQARLVEEKTALRIEAQEEQVLMCAGLCVFCMSS